MSKKDTEEWNHKKVRHGNKEITMFSMLMIAE